MSTIGFVRVPLMEESRRLVETPNIIDNYFDWAPKIPTSCFKMTFQGRKITVLGISKKEVRRELKQAVGWMLQKRAKNLDSWNLSKKKVSRMRQLIECHKEVLSKRQTDGDQVSEEIAEANQLLEQFQKVQNYIIDEELFSKLLPFLKQPLLPLPRMERLKQALRTYFRSEDLLFKVTDDMRTYVQGIKDKLLQDQKEKLSEDLKKAKTTEERVKILADYDLQAFTFKGEEATVFFDFLTLIISPSNEYLLKPIQSLEDDDDKFDPIKVNVAEARITLDKICCNIALFVSFVRKNQEFLHVGSLEKPPDELLYPQ